MSRLRVTACCVLAAGAAVAAQQPTTANRETAKAWTLSLEVDASTNQKSLTATARARVSGPSSPMYQLTLTCDRGRQTTTLATFDAAGGDRPILRWHTRVIDGSAMAGTVDQVFNWLDIHYRIDEGPVRSTTLEHVEDLAPPEQTGQTEHQNIGQMDPHFVGLPGTRLLITDVFPNETAEFSFAALTPEERSAMQSICFPAATAGK